MATPTPHEKEPPASYTADQEKHAYASDSASDHVDAASFGLKSEVSLVRKLDRHVLPGVVLLYLLSFLDRSNVANARLDGLTTNPNANATVATGTQHGLTDGLNMTGNQYLTGLSLFFVGYILFEVFWNVILKQIGPRIWLPSVTFVWGVVATLQGVIVYNGGQTGVAGFLVVRFFLGVAEGALFPGVVYYLSQWYKRGERTYRVAMFFSAASLAGAFGGILAYGIGFMKGVGGLNGWTCVLAIAGFWYIMDWPSKAKFLTEDERAFVNARLKADSDATNDEKFSWRQVAVALKDPKVWLYGAGYHTLR
nr:putative tartrate transporter [Quercus suber]